METEKRMIYANEAEKELVDAIQNIHLSGCDWVNGYCEGLSAAHSLIQSIPSVDAVEVVHGRWKAHKPDCRGYTAGFICSSCGNIVYTDYCMKECEYNYCPNCGAKMDGDGNGA